jgi:hypothetical protein
MTRPYTFSPEGLAARQRTGSAVLKKLHAKPGFTKRTQRAAITAARENWLRPEFRKRMHAMRADPLQEGFNVSQRAAFRTLVNHGIPRTEARQRILNRAKLRDA